MPLAVPEHDASKDTLSAEPDPFQRSLFGDIVSVRSGLQPVCSRREEILGEEARRGRSDAATAVLREERNPDLEVTEPDGSPSHPRGAGSVQQSDCQEGLPIGADEPIIVPTTLQHLRVVDPEAEPL